MNAIEARHLIKRFGTVTAVNDVSLTVREGETFGFLGPNGAGKTTTMRLLTSVLTPDAGTVLINGIDIHRHPLDAKMQMGVIPENRLGLRRHVRGAEPASEWADVRHVPGTPGREDR